MWKKTTGQVETFTNQELASIRPSVRKIKKETTGSRHRWLHTHHYDNHPRTYFVNRLELLCNCKDGLDVVFTQFLNQVGDGRVILVRKGHESSAKSVKHPIVGSENQLKMSYTHVIMAHGVHVVF